MTVAFLAWAAGRSTEIRQTGRVTSSDGWVESGVLLGQAESKKLISHPSGDVKQGSGAHAWCRAVSGELSGRRSTIPSDGVTAGWEPAPLRGSPFSFVKNRVRRSLGVLSCRRVQMQNISIYIHGAAGAGWAVAVGM